VGSLYHTFCKNEALHDGFGLGVAATLCAGCFKTALAAAYPLEYIRDATIFCCAKAQSKQKKPAKM
jgi:hypothetical protein